MLLLLQVNDQFELRINNQPFSYLYTQGKFFWHLSRIKSPSSEKVKKEFTYEDDKPSKDYGGGGGGWDEVKKAKTDQESFSRPPAQKYAGFGSGGGGGNQSSSGAAGGFGQPSTGGGGGFGQPSTGAGGFLQGFEKFDYSKK